jgi:hypothetical protein
MPSIPINNLTNKTDINGAELLPFVRDGKTFRCSVSGLFYNNVITTSKINNGAVTPAKLSTGGPSWNGVGNVGIGTLTPEAKLEVKGGSVDDSIPELRISGSSGNISTYVSLCAGFYNPIALNNDKGIIFTEGTVDTGNLVIAPHSTSIGGIRINSSGNVGIKKSSPTTALDVNGIVTATGFSGPLTASNVSDGVITTEKIANSNVTPAKLSQPLTLGTAVATTSGTSVDFTSIPSWVKRVTVLFRGFSTSGNSAPCVRLGTSSGIISSGYLGSMSGNTVRNVFTTGFGIQSTDGPNIIHGSITIINISSNNWVASGVLGASNGALTIETAGSVDLAAQMTQLRITTTNGTDTFDAGQVNIMYE